MVAALASDSTVASFVAAWPGAPALSSPREGSASAPDGAGNLPTTYRFVSAEYFDVLDIDVLSGRAFTSAEATSRAAVAVVSEATARQFWAGMNPVGQQLRVTPHALPPQRSLSPVVVVLGVVRDVRGYSPRGNSSDNTGVYLPITAMDAGTTLIARVHGDPEVARQTLTDRLTSIEPTLGMILTMRTLGALRTYPLRVGFWVTVVLGTLALVLTLSGIYGVLSYLVVQRTKEIGVRMALGATPRTVTRMVQWQSLRLVAIGLAIGTSLVWSVSAILMTKMPVSGPFAGAVDLFDGVAYASSLLTILAACVLAASVPARRAARIDPSETLRHD